MNPGDLRRGEQPDTAPGFWRTPIRFLFGFDVFISYGRSDADGYAELLETKLEALGFATFRTNVRSTPESGSTTLSRMRFDAAVISFFLIHRLRDDHPGWSVKLRPISASTGNA